jgi:hypothetical protein
LREVISAYAPTWSKRRGAVRESNKNAKKLSQTQMYQRDSLKEYHFLVRVIRDTIKDWAFVFVFFFFFESREQKSGN